MLREKGKHILNFLGLEVVVKTSMLCLVATFLVSMLLALAPAREEFRVSVRGGVEDTLKYLQPTGREFFMSQYAQWLKGVLEGDLGRGKNGQKTTEEILEKTPVTLGLTFASIVPSLLVSFLVGLPGYRLHPSRLRNLAYLFTTLPAFFLGYLLLGVFGFRPSSALNYLLAVLTLALSGGIINEMGRVVSNAMSCELSRDYVQTARAKGLGETTFPGLGTVALHTFRNALINIVPRLGSLFAWVISGCLVVEQIFSIHGLSFMLLDGLIDKDTSRVLTVILLSVVVVRVGTLISDLIYLLLNPRYGQR
jgi:ABC-type dipeptide/oligopeptide/nickel transport system permease component